MAKKETTQTNNEIIIRASDNGYDKRLYNINEVWDNARNNAALPVNTELLDANWETGSHIVEFQQRGKVSANHGEGLLEKLSKDLTLRRGKGFCRSNLTYMRKLYLTFSKCGTMSHIFRFISDSQKIIKVTGKIYPQSDLK